MADAPVDEADDLEEIEAVAETLVAAEAAADGDTGGDDEPVALASDAPAPPDEADMPARIEALLFVSDGAVEEPALARALGVTRRRLDGALDTLAEQLRESGRGVRLQRGPEGAQLVTAPEAAAHVEYFLGLEAARRLSNAALETLAIIAYRQPVTRGTIETIRGVSSDAAIATLRARGLIADGGRAEGPGRPVLWVTTQRFLHHFGLERPSDLPPLPADIELPDEDAGAQLEMSIAEDGAADAATDAPAAESIAVDETMGDGDGVAEAAIEGAAEPDAEREPAS